jgi:hypothetical protein
MGADTLMSRRRTAGRYIRRESNAWQQPGRRGPGVWCRRTRGVRECTLCERWFVALARLYLLDGLCKVNVFIIFGEMLVGNYYILDTFEMYITGSQISRASKKNCTSRQECVVGTQHCRMLYSLLIASSTLGCATLPGFNLVQSHILLRHPGTVPAA